MKKLLLLRQYYIYVLIAAVLIYAAAILLVSQQDTLYAIQDLSVWRSDYSFFKSLADRPFGLLQYSALFLTQFFYFPWLGIFLLVALWGISALISFLALRLHVSMQWVTVLPIFCLLIPFTQMGYWIYLLKLSSFWYLFTMLWLWWAVMLWIVFQLRIKLIKILLCIAWVCVLTPWNGFLICPFEVIDHFMYIPHYSFFGVLIVQLFAKFSGKYIVKNVAVTKILSCIGILTLTLAFVWSSMLNFRYPCFHAELRMQQEGERGDWQSLILETENVNRTPTRQMILMRDIALLHVGALYNVEQQVSCVGVRPDIFHGPKVYLAFTGGPLVYYLAGYINDSYRWTFENAVEYGFSPQRLRMLLRCALVNEEWDLCRRYVRLLRLTFFHREFANNMEHLIGHPERFSSYPEIDVARKVMVKDETLTPATIYMEPKLFTDPTSPLKLHYQCHFQGQGKLQTY